jgi:hypothetical protein
MATNRTTDGPLATGHPALPLIEPDPQPSTMSRIASQALPFDEPAQGGMSHLVVVQELNVPPEGVRAAIEDPDGAWLGQALDGADAPPGMHRYLTDLGLQIGDRSGGLFRKAAFIDLGPMRRVGRGTELEIGWQAATLAPLFPVFAGQLAIADGELRLEGWYAPPGGLLGRVADRVLLNLAARATGRWLLASLADAARAEADEGA